MCPSSLETSPHLAIGKTEFGLGFTVFEIDRNDMDSFATQGKAL